MSDGIFQYILTETQSTRIVKVGGYDSHLPLLFIYHRRSQFTDFFSYSHKHHSAGLHALKAIKLQVKPIHSFIIRDYVVGLAETAKVALIYLP